MASSSPPLNLYNIGLLLVLILAAIDESLGSQYRRSVDKPGELVIGRFKAPAPDRIYKQHVPSDSKFGAHTLSASFQVIDRQVMPEKTVHGLVGSPGGHNRKARPDHRTVSAKFQVSDEGLNYPPSKLSSDIHGNVAEIVTAPPEALDNDFLIPEAASNLFGERQV